MMRGCLLPETLAPHAAPVQPRHDLIHRLPLRLGQIVEQEHREQRRRHHERHEGVVAESVRDEREGESDHQVSQPVDEGGDGDGRGPWG